MDGSVWWMWATTGRLPEWAGKKIGEAVFSSPAVAQVSPQAVEKGNPVVGGAEG